ncbi:MAG TPA: hypothetical protein PKV86_14475, partial [Syntrophobacteraceae bacterium]|nr:hypothetical protein [Syntrophobacteraceae bacterium]
TYLIRPGASFGRSVSKEQPQQWKTALQRWIEQASSQEPAQTAWQEKWWAAWARREYAKSGEPS